MSVCVTIIWLKSNFKNTKYLFLSLMIKLQDKTPTNETSTDNDNDDSLDAADALNHNLSGGAEGEEDVVNTTTAATAGQSDNNANVVEVIGQIDETATSK